MNYIKIYNNIVDRGRVRIIDGYKELHHIVPKCMGGLNSADNLVYLTPEEHYVAHQLLVKIYPGNKKIIYAAMLMTSCTNIVKRNNKLFGWLRRRASEAMSKSLLEFHHNKGKPAFNRNIPHSQETKDKISKSRKGQTAHNKGKPGMCGKDNPMYGKPSPNTGKVASHETRKKMSISKKALPKLVCQHCGKSMDPGNFKRYHGDKCKEIK